MHLIAAWNMNVHFRCKEHITAECLNLCLVCILQSKKKVKNRKRECDDHEFQLFPGGNCCECEGGVLSGTGTGLYLCHHDIGLDQVPPVNELPIGNVKQRLYQTLN